MAELTEHFCRLSGYLKNKVELSCTCIGDLPEKGSNKIFLGLSAQW